MAEIPTFILPLADADDYVRIGFFLLFGLIWLVAQVVSAIRKGNKNGGAGEATGDDDVEFEPVVIERDAHRPPPRTDLERKLEQRRQRAEQRRREQELGDPGDFVPTQVARDAGTSYEELRRQRQQAQRGPQPPRPAPPPRSGVVSPVFAQSITAAPAGVSAPISRPPTAGRDAPPRVAALLRPKTLRDVVAATEALRPPIALRDPDDVR